MNKNLIAQMLMLILLLLACSPTVVQSTPTLTPSRTPTPLPTSTPSKTPTPTPEPAMQIDTANFYRVLIDDELLEKYLDEPLKFALTFPEKFDYSVYGLDVAQLSPTEVRYFPREVLGELTDVPFVIYEDDSGNPLLLFNPETRSFWHYQTSEYTNLRTGIIVRVAHVSDPYANDSWDKLKEPYPGAYAEFWSDILAMNYIYYRYPNELAKIWNCNFSHPPLAPDEVVENKWYLDLNAYGSGPIWQCYRRYTFNRDMEEYRIFANEIFYRDLNKLKDEQTLLFKVGPYTEVEISKDFQDFTIWNERSPKNPIIQRMTFTGGFGFPKGTFLIINKNRTSIELKATGFYYLPTTDIYPGGSVMVLASYLLPFGTARIIDNDVPRPINALLDRYCDHVEMEDWIERLRNKAALYRKTYPYFDQSQNPPECLIETMPID